ncbi:MarR family winged helix-turn-helix transcriptional regulator [Nocardia australiensis]|uniref:MarR family winged helix-turn-helix transcriptional regulator n=1 Tax=Nocardia australiensis TaxID=2887191 RepID=UPI001D13DE57|nr:MarR family winged helix-turn-helix transcriptional regulator [Nocardia australiensis]
MPDDDPAPDEVWALLTRLVMDTREPWKRAVAERTGLPFSRIRILRRLLPGPLSLNDLARTLAMDAPATTVAVNNLEELGLAVREVDLTNRRRKQVSITAAGRVVLARAMATPDPAPAAFAALPPEELRQLRAVLRKIDY